MIIFLENYSYMSVLDILLKTLSKLDEWIMNVMYKYLRTELAKETSGVAHSWKISLLTKGGEIDKEENLIGK